MYLCFKAGSVKQNDHDVASSSMQSGGALSAQQARQVMSLDSYFPVFV